MNGRIAKIIRRFVRSNGAPGYFTQNYRLAKKRWTRLPRNQRAQQRREMVERT